MKAFSKNDKLRTFVAPKMTDIITFHDNNGKSAVYTRGNINGICRYLEMIGAPTILTNSGQSSHHFSPSYLINNDAATLRTVIAALCKR